MKALKELMAFRDILLEVKEQSGGKYSESFEKMAAIAGAENPFMTGKNLLDALEVLIINLQEENLFALNEKAALQKKVKISCLIAEKDVLSGFPDWIMALLTGNEIVFQLPENNRRFLPEVVSWFVNENPEMQPMFSFTEGHISKPEYLLTYPVEGEEQQLIKYFKAYPGLTRIKKKAVAVLTGNESSGELKMIVEGIMRFFNQGNHRISKIFVPEGYDFIPLLESFGGYMELKDHHRYRNNYDYYKSIYLLNKENFYDNELVLLKEDKEQVLSPLSVVYFSYYRSGTHLKEAFKSPYISKVFNRIAADSADWPEMKNPVFANWEFYPSAR